MIPPKPSMREARQPRPRNKGNMPGLPETKPHRAPPLLQVDPDVIEQRLHAKPPGDGDGAEKGPISRERRRSIERAQARQEALEKKEKEAAVLAAEDRKQRLQSQRAAAKKASSAREELEALEVEARERAKLKKQREKSRTPPRLRPGDENAATKEPGGNVVALSGTRDTRSPPRDRLEAAKAKLDAAAASPPRRPTSRATKMPGKVPPPGAMGRSRSRSPPR